MGLTTSLRGSSATNRERVRQLPSQLATINCELVYSDDEPILYELSDSGVETIARLEHERWYKERVSAGWRTGEKDPKRPDERVSPYLIPWGELKDEMKEYNRHDARVLALNLAKAGREIRRESEMS